MRMSQVTYSERKPELWGKQGEKKGLGGKGDIQSFQAIVAPLSPQQMFSELDTAGFVGVDFS